MQEPRHPSPAKATDQPIWLWVIVCAILVYALLPAMNRSHLEGFTYLTETMSLLVPDIAGTEPLWNTSLSFFYLSRPGTVWLMAPLSALSPGNGYDLLMWIALPFFLAGLVMTTKLWSGASWLASVAALLCLPIAIEAQFFHNDNVVAMAFSFCGIALLLVSQRFWAVAIAGALLSVAVLCRLDQILYIPLFGALSLLGSVTVRSALLRLGGICAGFMVIHAAMWLIAPDAADLSHRMRVVMDADQLWARLDAALSLHISADLGSFSIALGAGCFAIGGGFLCVIRDLRKAIAGQWRIWDRPIGLSLLLLGYPFAIYVVTIGKYYDPRGFLILLPFLGPWVALALDRWVFGLTRFARGRNTTRGMALAALITVPVVMPGMPILHPLLVLPVETENPVPSLTGRFWHGAAWRQWQDNFHVRDAAVHAAIADWRTSDQRQAITTSEWTTDRRWQHAMAMAGLRPGASPSIACAMAGETWALPGGMAIDHVRVHVPFLPEIVDNSAALFLAYGADCLRSVPASNRYATMRIGALVALPAKVRLQASQPGLWSLTDADLDQLRADASGRILASPLVGTSDDIRPEDVARRIVQRARDILN